MRLLSVALLTLFAVGPSQARLPGPPPPSPQTSDVTDPDAYAVYASVLFGGPLGSGVHATLIVRQETEWAQHEDGPCRIARLTDDPEWEAVGSDLIRQNAHVKLLKPLFPTNRPYRLISKAAIESDDARNFPGISLPQPGMIQYVAVSGVGFDWSKTKALVWVSSRESGHLHCLELRDGRWVDWSIGSCGWIA